MQKWDLTVEIRLGSDDDGVIEYPDWQKPLQEAMVEVDKDKLKSRVTAHAQTITVFDAPGAGTGPGQGTLGIAIHPSGAIAGASIDANSVWHGFLRAPCGALTTFDAPGAGGRSQM